MKAKTKDYKRIIKRVLPEYHKQSINVVAAENVTLYDLNWSGGTKNIYHFAPVNGNEIDLPFDMGARAPWNNPYENQKVNIPQGFCVIQEGFFRGQETSATIYFHPNDMPKQITD
jgi:hypothetical protein